MCSVCVCVCVCVWACGMWKWLTKDHRSAWKAKQSQAHAAAPTEGQLERQTHWMEPSLLLLITSKNTALSARHVPSPPAHLQAKHKVAADALLSDDVLHGAKRSAQVGVKKLRGQQTHRGGHQVVWQGHICDLGTKGETRSMNQNNNLSRVEEKKVKVPLCGFNLTE